MSSFSVQEIEIVEDNRNLKEVFQSVQRRRRCSRVNLQDIVDQQSQYIVQSPGRLHRIGIVSQDQFSSRAETLTRLMRTANQVHGLERFSFLAALLVAEKYDLRELRCDSLILAHRWVGLPRRNNPGKMRRYVLGISSQDELLAYRERPEWVDLQTDFAFAMPIS